jgi:PPM family protein phosphatase
MRLSWGARTHRGIVRRLNEDAVLAGPPVFLVADGMGGHAAGEVASGIAVGCFHVLENRPRVEAGEVIGLLDEANTRILAHVSRTPAAAGMGTTVCGLVAVDNGGRDELFGFNVGDSRLYVWRDGGLAQVSVDHTAVQELIDGGVIDEPAVASHPDRHVITRALGTDPGPRPDVWFIAPLAGDRYLLCTDGLTREVPVDRLADLLGTMPDPVSAADELVEQALRAGGRDNVSVVVVDVLEGADRPWLDRPTTLAVDSL